MSADTNAYKGSKLAGEDNQLLDGSVLWYCAQNFIPLANHKMTESPPGSNYEGAEG